MVIKSGVHISFLLLGIIFYSCGLRVSNHYIHQVSSSDIKAVTTKVLEAYYNKKIDSSADVSSLPDEVSKQQLQKLKVSSFRISFTDSIVYYWKNSHHVSIRLYPRDVDTYFFYDFADKERDLSAPRDFWDSGNKKVGTRTYIGKIKTPTTR